MNSNWGDKPALPRCCLHGRICFPSGVGVVRVSPGSRGGRLGWGFCLPRGEQSNGTPASAQLEPCTRVYTESGAQTAASCPGQVGQCQNQGSSVLMVTGNPHGSYHN